MWYKILAEKEFVDYFSDDNNIFLVIENGERRLAPKFQRYANIVCGVTSAWTMFQIDSSTAVELPPNTDPDVRYGYEFCYERLHKTDSKNLDEIMQSFGEDRYDASIDTLSAEQCAVLLMHPFWSRMGGSFELDFQQNGGLKEYLLALSKKCCE